MSKDIFTAGIKVKNGWFCITDYCHVPPDKPGFYAIYLQNLQTNNSELVYIGTAKNLKRRLNNHEVVRLLNRMYEYPIHVNIKCRVFEPNISSRRTLGWYNKQDQADNERLLIEARLIKRLQPRLNIQRRK